MSEPRFIKTTIHPRCSTCQGTGKGLIGDCFYCKGKGYTPQVVETADLADVPAEKKPARKRDDIWDAICAEFHLKPQTHSEQSRVGKVVRDAKIKGATPAMIHAKIESYRATMPGITCTPEAILKHWDSLLVEAEHTGGRDLTPEERAALLEGVQNV